MKKHTFLLLFCMLISASCAQSNMQSEWSCPTNMPDKCYDVSHSDHKALNALSNQISVSKPQITRTLHPTDSIADIPFHTGYDYQMHSSETFVPSPARHPAHSSEQDHNTSLEPMRIPEELAKIWIAPYVDKSGNWHGGRYVYAQIRPPRWKRE